VIEEKIVKYRENLNLAQRLATNQYADHEYYERMVSKLEKMLIFYENLKVWEENSKK
jgi:hypothetical protein